MKKLSLLAIAAGISQLSMSSMEPNWFLTQRDFQLENEEASAKGITNPDTGASTPIRWQCFRDESIRAECLPVERKGSIDYVPDEDTGYDLVARFEQGGHSFSFELEYEDDFKTCRQSLVRHNDLLQKSQDACFFAAYEPEDWDRANDPLFYDQSYWIAYGLKTPDGQIMAPIFDSDSEDP